MDTEFEQQLLQHHAGLLRWCTSLTHDPGAADDLVQETWIEAWRNRHKLTDPAGMGAWLRTIAQYVCLRWQRKQRWEIPLDDEWLLDELDSEQSDLAGLIEQAMGRLPLTTRNLLMARYLEEKSLAEIAAQSGINENVLHVRLHRGKLALAKILKTHLLDQTADYGLFIPDNWQSTRLWCYSCGRQHLRTKFDPGFGNLILDCERCGFTLEEATGATEIIGTVKSLKSALNRLMNWSHDYFTPAAERLCGQCHSPVRVKTVPRQTARGNEIILEAPCTHCGKSPNVSFYGQAIHSPAGQRFWRDYARIRIVPHQYIERDGQAAVLTVLESLTSANSLTVISSMGNGRILYTGNT